jgi:hypothetical protein
MAKRAILHLYLARVGLIGSETFPGIHRAPNIGIGLSLNKMTWLDV